MGIIKNIKRGLFKINNRYKAFKEHKKRLESVSEYDLEDILISDDFITRVIRIKINNISNTYGLDLDKYEEFEQACFIAENDFSNTWLY